MKTKKIEDLSNQELVAEYSFIVVKESSGPNGGGIKEFEKTMQQSQLLRTELLSRLGESEESIFSYAWEHETWAADIKRSSELQVHFSRWETDKKRPLTLSDAIQEAIYLLGTFDEVGHANYDLKNGKGASNPQAEEQKETVRKELRQIRAFIRKHMRSRLTHKIVRKSK